jgi:1-phosphofructokinase family hexose kinase
VAKVVCVTLNTAIDYVIEVDDVKLGTTMRAKTTSMIAAGKGVVVAVGVNLLGGRTLATGFIGEATREVFAALTAEGVEAAFEEVPGATRINVTLLEPGGRETHIQTHGYSLSATYVTRLLAKLRSVLTAGDVLVIGGSYPPGTPPGTSVKLVECGKTCGAYVMVDASGPALADALAGKPHMIKPNLRELAEIVGYEVGADDPALVDAGGRCLAAGIERVVISRGARGAIVLERRMALKAYVETPKTTLTAAVGSGDALVAGLAFGILTRLPLEIALRLGVACGAANLETRLPGRFKMTDVRAFERRACIESVAQ